MYDVPPVQAWFSQSQKSVCTWSPEMELQVVRSKNKCSYLLGRLSSPLPSNFITNQIIPQLKRQSIFYKSQRDYVHENIIPLQKKSTFKLRCKFLTIYGWVFMGSPIDLVWLSRKGMCQGQTTRNMCLNPKEITDAGTTGKRETAAANTHCLVTAGTT